jgi:hypothetical protein
VNRSTERGGRQGIPTFGDGGVGPIDGGEVLVRQVELMVAWRQRGVRRAWDNPARRGGMESDGVVR